MNPPKVLTPEQTAQMMAEMGACTLKNDLAGVRKVWEKYHGIDTREPIDATPAVSRRERALIAGVVDHFYNGLVANGTVPLEQGFHASVQMAMALLSVATQIDTSFTEQNMLALLMVGEAIQDTLEPVMKEVRNIVLKSENQANN